jgi:hypothetical protein
MRAFPLGAFVFDRDPDSMTGVEGGTPHGLRYRASTILDSLLFMPYGFVPLNDLSYIVLVVYRVEGHLSRHGHGTQVRTIMYPWLRVEIKEESMRGFPATFLSPASMQ